MLTPRIEPNSVVTLKLLMEKTSDAAMLVGVGTKDVQTRYYLGQSDTGISFYFRSDGTKVIRGSTTSESGKGGQQGDIINCTLDRIEGKIIF